MEVASEIVATIVDPRAMVGPEVKRVDIHSVHWVASNSRCSVVL